LAKGSFLQQVRAKGYKEQNISFLAKAKSQISQIQTDKE
jgi:hypothetical protein